MPAKPKKASPAQQRAAAKSTTDQKVPPQKKESDWTPWEKKIDHVLARDLDAIVSGWLSNIPEINPPGSAPREGIGSISAVHEILPTVPKKGHKDAAIFGGRSAILHEGFYLINKAIHVQISCSNHVSSGNHTWAIVDAYQASLFALGGIMAFLGVTIERETNDFILIDVWGLASRNSKDSSVAADTCKFIRFKTLDHFHKWAILKRLLRTLKSDSQLLVFVSEAIQGLDDKSFAQHRNAVHYQSQGWLAEDLFEPDFNGPIQSAVTSQALYDAIYESKKEGTVYLMCALIELACEFANRLFDKGVLPDEKKLLDRRHAPMQALAKFDWATVTLMDAK